MSLLIDTHILVWLMEGDETLPPVSLAVIDAAARQGGVVVSSISFWEIAMLTRKGRLTLSRPLEQWHQRIIIKAGIVEVPVSGEIGIESVNLPGALHDDPADRILVATARLGGLRLGTRDGRLLDYGREGHVDVVKL